MGKSKSRAICTIRVWEAGDPKRLGRAKAAAERLEGVVNSEANHMLQMLTVEYDPNRITLETIRAMVQSL